MGPRERDARVIADIACPVCGAAKGQPCARWIDAARNRKETRPSPTHTARRKAWQEQRDNDSRGNR